MMKCLGLIAVLNQILIQNKLNLVFITIIWISESISKYHEPLKLVNRNEEAPHSQEHKCSNISASTLE
jgi:hypothetical protein